MCLWPIITEIHGSSVEVHTCHNVGNIHWVCATNAFTVQNSDVHVYNTCKTAFQDFSFKCFLMAHQHIKGHSVLNILSISNYEQI